MQYNKYMGGVDKSDQLAVYHSISHKYMKYWKYLFFFFLQRMIVNSFILYRIAHTPDPRRKYTSVNFKLDLCSQLVAGYTNRKRRGPQPQTPATENSLNAINLHSHKCEKMQPDAKRPKRICRHCSKLKRKTAKGYPVETIFGCKLCGVYLCKNTCFIEYHGSILRH